MLTFQRTGYALVILLWIAAILLAILVPWPWLMLVLSVVHFVELIVIGYRTGKRAGHGGPWCIIMCMVFGLVWWLPIKRQLDPR